MEKENKKNDNLLLKQLKIQYADEKKFENYVGILQDCLSVDELKAKISILEEKLTLLNLLTNMTEKLHAEIEPLNCLKLILKTKLAAKNQTLENKSDGAIDLKELISKVNKDHFNVQNTSTELKSSSPQNIKKIATDTTIYNLISHKLHDEHTALNSVSIVKFDDLDKYVSPLSFNSVCSAAETDGKEVIDNIEDINLSDPELDSMSIVSDGGLEKCTSPLIVNDICNTAKTDCEETIDSIEDINFLNPELDSMSIVSDGDLDKCTSPMIVNDICNIAQIDCEEIIDNFEGLNLKEELLHGIYNYGFKNPLAIQQRAISSCIKGYNVFVQSPSGSGKTVTLIISVLQKIDTNLNQCQALIVTPRQDVVMDIQKMLTELGKFMEVVCLTSVGGTNIHADKRRLSNIPHPHVIVGTTGRILDLIMRKALTTQFIKVFALVKPFKLCLKNETTENIMKSLNNDIQTIILSDTVKTYLLNLIAHSVSNNQVRIFVQDEHPHIPLELSNKQFCINVTEKNMKLLALSRFYALFNVTKSMIFCNTEYSANMLTQHMNKNLHFMKFDVNKKTTSKERKILIERFRSESSGALITTDGLAQNVCFKDVSVIINYDLPLVRKTYVHRVKQTNFKCIVINFISNFNCKWFTDCTESVSLIPMSEIPDLIETLKKDLL